jgi:nitrite reductase/ring-hydroxylating ferredoxin subunit
MSVAEQDWTARARASRGEIDLARTSPNTPGGRFMRRFWIPVHRAEDLPKGQAKPIRVMSEDFALYRGDSGVAQVIGYRCPHRGAQMHLGWVEGDDIRCVYHGWKFDCAGQCIEQPAEEAGFARKRAARLPALPDAARRRPDREPGTAGGAVQLPAMLREQHGRGARRLCPQDRRLAFWHLRPA